MSAKKSYNRFFIIFQEEDKGYGVGPDRPPTGYAKVETKSEKSKVTVYVQNLKPFESGECLYKCYLISHQDDKDSTVYLGIMNIDDLGRGESSWESGAENAFDSKTSIDKFNGAAIVVEREGIEKVIAPLAGYMSKDKFNWRSIIPVIKKVQKEEIVQADIYDEALNVELSEEAKKFEEYEESINEIAEKNEYAESINEIAEKDEYEEIDVVSKEPENGMEGIETSGIPEDIDSETEELHDEMKGNAASAILENVVQEPEKMQIPKETEFKIEEPFFYEQPVSRPVAGVDDEIRNKNKEHKYSYSGCMGYNKYDYRFAMRKMLEDILVQYEKIEKHKDLKECMVWKVDMEKCKKDGHKLTMYPCYDLLFYPMMYNPYFDHFKYIRKHGHYLFGIKCDKDKKVLAILFAIPGKNKPCEQPFGGKSGFTKWVSWGGKEDGYWIMMYDPMTGLILTQK